MTTIVTDNLDHISSTDTDTTVVVTPGPIGRFINRFKARPVRMALATTTVLGATTAASYVAYQQLRNGGDLSGAAQTAKRAANAFSSILS